MVPAFFKVSFRRFLLLLAAYSLTRLVFLLWNWPSFAQASGLEILQAFVVGLRFDTSAILLTNAVLFLLWFLPSRWLARPALRYFDVGLFALINWLCLGIGFVDAEFVNFIGKRTSYDLLFIRGDVEQQSMSILFTYWYICLSITALIVLLVYLYPKFSASSRREGWLSGLLWRLATVGLVITGMRGGYQFKPISPMNAYFSPKRELGLLALNSPFNVIKTRPYGVVEHARYFSDNREAFAILKKMTALTRPPLAVARKRNVVVLIVESLGSEYTGVGNDFRGYTPFFDQLARKSFYFKNNFANARRSIEGVPAVVCGLPAMMDEPMLTSDFANDRMDCLPKILGQVGYSSYFLHGAHNGSMRLDAFSTLAGFEHFVGLNEFPKGNPEDFDEYWGVLDEPMLQYAAQVMDQTKKPVFLTVFTLSSHHPYYIPPKYRGKFPKGTLEIHESMGYTDYSIEQFFKTAATKPWFNNTIFVITGDHTQKSDPEHLEYRSLIGGYRVPLLIYAPGLTSEQVGYSPQRITQHIDVLPSLLDLLGVTPRERLLVGQSVFDQGQEGRAYNFTTSSYWFMNPRVAVDFGRGDVPLRTYVHTNTFDRVEKDNHEPEFAEPLNQLKAVIHYMNDGLAHNTLYQWEKTP